VGSPFTYQITATNSPTSYGATGLPSGLTVNTTTGLISGTPTAGGTSTVTLSASNGTGTGDATLTLTINGTTASVSPSSLAFGDEPGGITSSPQAVTLSNTGSSALTVTSIAFTGANAGDFTEANTCTPSVAVGSYCTITVLFTPAASGTRVASLAITDNASFSPQAVTLSGTGTHDVILSWSDSPTSGVIGYNVYRGTTSGGESSTPLNSSPIAGPTYADENVQAGQTYYYFVTAVVSNGISQSAPSNEASATVPSP
jgi:hypothetical protein